MVVAGEETTLYPSMLSPPFVDGVSHVIVADVELATTDAVSIVGCPGVSNPCSYTV